MFIYLDIDISHTLHYDVMGKHYSCYYSKKKAKFDNKAEF